MSPISLREPEDQCRVELWFMHLMDHKTPSYRTFGYFINEVIKDSVEEIFTDINKKIFQTEHVDLQHLYMDGSRFEANANKNTPGYEKKQLKRPDTGFLIRSPFSFRRSMRNCPVQA